MAKTLKELVQASKCRKGESDGTTRYGAYWEPFDSPCLRAFGGDQIVYPLVNYHLQLQYYRSGEVRAVMERYSRHQDSSYAGSWYFDRSSLLSLETIEEIIADLKKGVDLRNRKIMNPWGYEDVDDYYLHHESCYSDKYYDELRDALMELGMKESLPSPDEETEEIVG